MLVEDIAGRLVIAGHGTIGTDLFMHMMPEEPDECIAIFAYEGEAPRYVHDQVAFDTEAPRIQVMIRSAQPNTAYETAYAVLYSLETIRNEVINGVRYLTVKPTTSPEIIERDGNGLYLAVVNFMAEKEAS